MLPKTNKVPLSIIFCSTIFCNVCKASSPPNIILIVADDLGKFTNLIELYIYTCVISPNLEKLQNVSASHLCFGLGYNDISWHNPDIISPNLEKLAKNGVILESHYVQSICTPSRYLNVSDITIVKLILLVILYTNSMTIDFNFHYRAALMTGLYPIHTGRQVYLKI